MEWKSYGKFGQKTRGMYHGVNFFIMALLIFAGSTMFYYDLEDRWIETFLVGRRK